MKKIILATAAVLLATSTGAFAQTYYGSEPSVVGGGAVGTASSVAGGVVDGVAGGVGTVVGGVVGIPGQFFEGRSAFDGSTPYVGTTSCSVVGGGAVGTCNSAR